MTRMTGPDCVVMCNLINTYIHTYIHTYIRTAYNKYRIRRRRRAARSPTSQGWAESLCATIKGANREVSEGKADV